MSSHGYPTPLVVGPSGPHTHSCILLHGRGSNASSFGPEFLAAETSDDETLKQCFPGYKFIFPTAKKRRCILFKRMRINQWFDIYSLDDPSEHEHLQVEGLRESTQVIHQLIREEVGRVGAKNVILGGLSQGCACALHALLSFEETLGAFVGMSGWMPFQRQVNEILNPNLFDDGNGNAISFQFTSTETSEENTADQLSGSPVERALKFLRENLSVDTSDLANVSCLRTPVFLGHGEADEKVSCALGENITSTLRALGMDVEWKPYPGFGHWYKVPDEIDDIVGFLADV